MYCMRKGIETSFYFYRYNGAGLPREYKKRVEWLVSACGKSRRLGNRSFDLWSIYQATKHAKQYSKPEWCSAQSCSQSNQLAEQLQPSATYWQSSTCLLVLCSQILPDRVWPCQTNRVQLAPPHWSREYFQQKIDSFCCRNIEQTAEIFCDLWSICLSSWQLWMDPRS